MQKFFNENGETYFILERHNSRVLLESCATGEFVVVAELYENNWWQGTYFKRNQLQEATNHLKR